MGSFSHVSDADWQPTCLSVERLPSVYHDDWRVYLDEKNKKKISCLISEPLNSCRFTLYTRNVVTYFIQLAKNFSLPPEVVYISVDLYDKFWLFYLCGPSKNRDRHWKNAKESINELTCLVALTCLQIASKLSCTSKLLTVRDISNMMTKFGFAVDKSIVLHSEMRVLRTIKLELSNISVLSYVEMLIETTNEHLAEVDSGELLVVCVKVINIAYMFHQEIYNKLRLAFQKRLILTRKERRRFLAIQGDWVRLAISILCVGTTMYDPSKALTTTVTNYLSHVTKYKFREITVLTDIITHIILRTITSDM